MCATRASVCTVLGSVLSVSRVAKTLQGGPTTHPRRTQVGGAGDFSWSAAQAFNTCAYAESSKLKENLNEGLLNASDEF